jgi:transposase
VHHEFVPRERSITAAYDIEVLTRLRENVRRRLPQIWKDGRILHHDNALSHVATAVLQFLAEKKNYTMPQPPYSPDLAPCDFWLFPKLKTGLRGRRFATADGIKENAEAGKRAIKKTILKNVSKLGKTDGASVCAQKEGTLKVFRLVSPTVHSIKVYSKIPGTF